ncbi:MAG: hypothetical protein WCW04_00025 [Candidatus Paceibacterota bacterium]
MDHKKIIILIGVVFLALVGYKLISSNVQENKEKAVLQEKVRLEKEPLEQCLNNIDNESKAETNKITELMRDIRTKESQDFCLGSHNPNEFYNAGPTTWKEYCWPSYEDEQKEIKKISDKAKIDREECYKRYK